jgi:hypothetical protein
MMKLFALFALLGTLALTSHLADAQVRGIERGGSECGPVLGQMYIYALPNNATGCIMHYSRTCDGITTSWTGSCT